MLIGIVTTIAFFGFGISEYEAAQSGHDPTQMAKLADSVESSGVVIPLFIVFVVGSVVGTLIVAWSLWRRRIVPDGHRLRSPSGRYPTSSPTASR